MLVHEWISALIQDPLEQTQPPSNRDAIPCFEIDDDDDDHDDEQETRHNSLVFALRCDAPHS